MVYNFYQDKRTLYIKIFNWNWYYIPENKLGGGGGPGGDGGAIGARRGGAGGGGISPTRMIPRSDKLLPCKRDSISANRCFVSVWRASSVSSFSLVRSRFDSKSSFSSAFASSSYG